MAAVLLTGVMGTAVGTGNIMGKITNPSNTFHFHLHGCSYGRDGNHSGPRGQWRDQNTMFSDMKREQREKVACEGVPELWSLSPARPDLE